MCIAVRAGGQRHERHEVVALGLEAEKKQGQIAVLESDPGTRHDHTNILRIHLDVAGHGEPCAHPDQLNQAAGAHLASSAPIVFASLRLW